MISADTKRTDEGGPLMTSKDTLWVFTDPEGVYLPASRIVAVQRTGPATSAAAVLDTGAQVALVPTSVITGPDIAARDLVERLARARQQDEAGVLEFTGSERWENTSAQYREAFRT